MKLQFPNGLFEALKALTKCNGQGRVFFLP